MRHTPLESSSGPTLNHNTPKPLISHPPSRPGSALPSEGRDRADDPLDVAVTMQRPALEPERAGEILAPRATADSTSEVQVEDILLEVYAEAPAPPSRRSGGPLSTAGTAPQPPAHVAIAKAIASAVPMAPAESAALDALLRASDPAFLPFAGGAGPRSARPQTTSAFTHPHAAYASYGGAGADAEPPSVAPVAFASADLPFVSHGAAPQPPASSPSATSPGARRGRGRAIATVVLLAVGLGAAAGAAVGVRRGTIAELRERAKTLIAVGGPTARAAAASERPAVASPASPPPPSLASPGAAGATASVGSPPSPDSGSAAPASSAPGSAAPASSAPGSAASASAGSPASPASGAAASAGPPSAARSASVSPSTPVDALPAQVIPPDSALVTFPEWAQGHRVFVDGRAMAVTLAPMQLPCGRHTLRIGSSGKPRVTDLACGQPVTLR